MIYKFILTISVDITEHTDEEDQNIGKVLENMFRGWADDLKSGSSISSWGKVSSDGKIIVEVEKVAPE